MSWFDKIFSAIGGALFGRIDPATEETARANAQHAAPVVWLVGKTGSGKSSIIRVLTDYDQVEVGNGFAPCTRTASVFDYPATAPIIRFLDTRGLEEPGYDPSEDISWAEGQSHLILATMRVSDPTQQAVLAVIQAARNRHPEWPVIVAQTGLHDLYPIGMTHPDPDDFPKVANIDSDKLRGLRQALAYQCALFDGLPGMAPEFVPIDFTRPEDGFIPPDYRSTALRDALERAGLTVFNVSAQANKNALAMRCWASILSYATLAAGGAAIPVPFADLPTFAAMNGLMLQALGRNYTVEWTPAAFYEFVGALGVGTLLEWGLRFGLGELLKLIPILGSVEGAVINGVLAFGMTIGLGLAACVWLDYQRRGEAAPPEEIKAAFVNGMRQRAAKAKSK